MGVFTLNPSNTKGIARNFPCSRPVWIEPWAFSYLLPWTVESWKVFPCSEGAFYYTYPEKQKTYEQTVYDVLSYAAQEEIPYRYLQLDDWWYYIVGPGYGATVKWEARPSVFPHGLG